jgi:uncharacterized HAD superfamily protein
MLRIGFDIDGILANAVLAMNRQLNRPESHTPDWLPNNWDWLGIDFGMSKEDVRAAWKHYFADPYTFVDMEELPGVVALRKFMWDMHDKGVTVEYYFISNRSGDTAIQQTGTWLHEHALIGDDVNATFMLTPEKGEAAKLFKLNYFIEDNLDNALDVSNKANARCYLLDTPYNRTKVNYEEERVYRIASVEEYLNDIRRYVEVTRLGKESQISLTT